MFLDYKYSVRFAILHSSIIINVCGPDRFELRADNPVDQKKAFQETKQHIAKRNNKDGFYSKLERDILKRGFRNPIIVNSGHIAKGYRRLLPDELQTNTAIEKVIICDRHGGSRLYIAKKYNLEIPCLINSFNTKFINCEELASPANIFSKFIDPPEKILHNEDGIHVVNVPQVQMEQEDDRKKLRRNEKLSPKDGRRC